MKRARLVSLLLFVALAAFYAATSRGVFVYGDDILMYRLTAALAEEGSVALASSPRRGEFARAVVGPGRRYFVKYGPGLSLAAFPFYELGSGLERAGLALPAEQDALGNPRTGTRIFLTGLSSALFGALAGWVLFRLALTLGYSERVAVTLALTAGLATPLAHYASAFLSESLSALALTGAVLAVARMDRSGGAFRMPFAALLAGGGFAALAIATKIAHGVALPILLLATVLALRRAGGRGRDLQTALAVWAAPIGLALFGLALYNQARFGRWLETGYGREARAFTFPFFEGVAGLLVSPWRGLVEYAPVVLAGGLGFAALWQRNRAVAVAAAGIPIAVVALYARYYQWDGGGCWGPRFLVPILPLLVLPAGELLERAGRTAARLKRALFAATVAAGLLISALALLVPFDRHLPPATAGRAESPMASVPIWSFASSPLVRHARAAPLALGESLRLLSNRSPLPGPTEKDRPGLPDVAFARYGSHALLEWTRGALGVALLAGFGLWWMLYRGTTGAAYSGQRVQSARPGQSTR